jgi:hypothetical protein
VALPLLQSPLRSGEAERTIVEVLQGQPFVLLAVEAPTPGEAGAPLRFEVRRSGGDAVWAQELSEADLRHYAHSTGAITFMIPAVRLPAGSYALRSTDHEGSTVFEAAFEVVHGRPTATKAPQ